MLRRILKSDAFTIFLIVLGAALVIVSLTACAPEAGTVTKKDYDSEYSYWLPGTTTCSGQPARCTTTPGYYVYVPESYQLRITNGDDSGWISVDSRMYDNTRVGDYYDRGQITAQ